VILIGLGANLPSRRFGTPKKTLEAALDELENRGVHVVLRSRWYSSAPVPPSDQPRYVNAVVAVATDLSPEALLELLHAIEREFGRHRTVANAAREIDLDAERAFVLHPICDIDPGWIHPQSGLSAHELAEAVGGSADVQLCDQADC
jgi:2-amino-4-hydroxy-6-hydroxymethyldihydropteridine diphosphokinase